MVTSNAPRFFTFVAQSLDNRSPDIIAEFGILLTTDELRSPERTRIVGKTTGISSRGRQFSLSKGSECRGFVLGDEVLFHVGTDDKDVAGRAAPVLCLGVFTEPDSRIWRDVLLGELDEFAQRAGRTIGPLRRSEFVQLVDLVFANRKSMPGAALLRAVAAVASSLNPQAARDRDAPPRRATAALVVTSAHKRVVAADPQLVGLLNNPDVAVIDLPLESDGELAALAGRLDELSLLDSPTLALRDPYDAGRYFRAEDLSAALRSSKQGCYQTLCKLLGARSVSVLSITKLSKTGNRRLRVGGSLTGRSASAKAAMDSEDSDVLMERIELRQENAGGPPDLAAAEAFIRDRHLRWDHDLVHLVETARYEQNPSKELQLSYTTRYAMDRITHRVGDIAAIGTALSGSAGKRENYETVYEFKVSIIF